MICMFLPEVFGKFAELFSQADLSLRSVYTVRLIFSANLIRWDCLLQM